MTIITIDHNHHRQHISERKTHHEHPTKSATRAELLDHVERLRQVCSAQGFRNIRLTCLQAVITPMVLLHQSLCTFENVYTFRA
jgi:hypothetical protein